MIIYLPTDTMTREQEREIQAAVIRHWYLYGSIHVINAPDGHGVTMLDPTSITVTLPQPTQRVRSI